MALDTNSSFTGQISVVVQENRGSSLTTDSPLGTQTLLLEDASDFDESGGTMITASGAIYTYDTADMNADSIHLVSPLVADMFAGDAIAVYPIVLDRYAVVTVDGIVDPIVATVPFSMAAQLTEGTRTPELAETVLIAETAAEWVVIDVLTDPTIDGTFIDPNTVPIPPDLASDGLPPPVSPTPTVIGGIGFLIVKWDAISNHDFVRYEVHVSTVSGFTIDPLVTKIGETVGTQFTIKQLPDGSPLQYGPEDNPTQYFIRTLCFDVDGYATPSPEVAGSMVRVTGPDIAANSIYANSIVAGTITGDLLSATMLLSSVIKTAEAGGRVEIDSQGIRLYGPDGSTLLVNFPTDGSPVIIGSQISTDQLHVFGHTDFDDSVSFNRASEITLEGGQQLPPAMPLQVSPTWPTAFDLPTTFTDSGGNDVTIAQYDAFFYDPNGFGGVPTFLCLAYANDDNQTLYLIEIDATTGDFIRCQAREVILSGGNPVTLLSIDDIVQAFLPTFSSHTYWDIGCVRAGDWVYVLIAASFGTNGNIRVLAFDWGSFQYSYESNPSGDIPSGGQACWIGVTDNSSPETAAPVIVFKNSAGVARVTRYESASGLLNSNTGSVLTSGKSYTGAAVPWGVTIESNVLYLPWAGGADGTIQTPFGQAIHAYNATTGAYLGTAHDFVNGVLNVWAGSAFDGTRYYTSDGYRLFKHSKTEWRNLSFWISYTWNDGSGHETTIAPRRARVSLPNRAFGGLSFTPWTADATSGWEANVYILVSTPDTGVGSYTYKDLILYPATSGLLDDLVTLPGAPHDPTTNTFPGGGDGASLETGGGSMLIRGSGQLVLPQFPNNARDLTPLEGEVYHDSDSHMPMVWTGRRWQPFEIAGRALAGAWGWYTDFMEPTTAATFGPLIEESANSGASVEVTSNNVHPGVRELSTGGSSSSGICYVRTTNIAYVLGNGTVHFTCSFRVPTLSTSGQRFKVFIGYRDDIGSDSLPTNGVLLRYTDVNASGNFEYVTVDAGVDNGGLDSGVTPIANAWYRFDMYVNASGTAIDFYLNDAGYAQETNFIPGTAMGLMGGVAKTIGTSARTLQLDYMGAQGELAIRR